MHCKGKWGFLGNLLPLCVSSFNFADSLVHTLHHSVCEDAILSASLHKLLWQVWNEILLLSKVECVYVYVCLSVCLERVLLTGSDGN